MFVTQVSRRFGTPKDSTEARSTLNIAKFASVGDAKLIVGILNDWPTINDGEYARMETKRHNHGIW